MKKIIIILLFLINSLFLKVNAEIIPYYNSNIKINKALNILKKYNYNDTINTLSYNNRTHKHVIMRFENLSALNYNYSSYYAMTFYKDGRLYVFISNRLKYNSVEALACLILHESVHCASTATKDSIEEELEAHTQEVLLYNKIIKDEKFLRYNKNDELIVRLNKLSENYKDNTLKDIIQNNSSYKKIFNNT